ncbi:CC148 protein, partial [Polypterus senegalus]
MDREHSETEAAADDKVEYDDKEELLQKKGAACVVWRYFGFKRSDVDQTTIYCKCCREKLTLRMKDGLSSKKYKSVDYEQLHALSEAKRQAAANTEYKLRALKVEADGSTSVYDTEGADSNLIREKADLELQDFLQRDGINKDFFLQMEDYVQALDDDRKSFKAGTVHPIWQLKDDLQYKMMEMKSQASQKTDDFDCQVILEQVEFVKEQQNKILGKLKSEWIAVEEDIKETTVEDLLSAGEEIPSDVDQIPEQVFFMPCPYPELKASLMNEFQALGEKYKSRLQSINERLEAMDRYCGWSKEDHFVFQVTVDQYPHNQQNSRALCMDMLQRFLPHKSRQELNDHQRAWDWYYFTTEQKKTLLQGWIRDKQDLVMKAVMTIKEACAAYEEEEALRNDRKRQQEICAELKEKPPGGALLAAWRSQKTSRASWTMEFLCTALLDAMGPREGAAGRTEEFFVPYDPEVRHRKSNGLRVRIALFTLTRKE